MFFYLLFCGICYGIFKYRKEITSSFGLYRQLKRAIDPSNKYGCWYVLWAMIQLLNQTQTYQHQPQPEKFNRDYIKISYTYRGKPYYYLLKVQRGVTPIQCIQDENEKDITDIIVPYLGPNLDCHGISLKPSDFGYKKIKIVTIFDETVEFKENDAISL